MNKKKINEIDQFMAHMEKMDDHVFDGKIPDVGIFLVYGGKSLKLTHWPEVVELLRAAVAEERKYWEEF